MLRFSAIALISLLALNCSNDDSSLINDTNSGEKGEIVFDISFAPRKQKIAKTAAIESIDTITAYVYNSNDTEITHKDMTISGSKYSGSITIQATNDLRVALVFFDGSIVRYIGEDSDVDVPAGGETTAIIVEEYMGTSVTAPDTAIINTDYSVSWMERPFADEYELEEATSNDFSGSATVYTGTATSKLISGKSDNDMTYYYRARAKTKYGYGPWHSTGDDSTGITATEGTIIIGGDVPPDEPGSEIIYEGITFATIPAGSFEMGSNDGNSNEQPVHAVSLDSFEMSIYEITQGQYKDLMGNNPSRHPEGDNYPVEKVSWYGAITFCNKLSDKAEFDRCYDESTWECNFSANGFRLPSEAEWEYACRAGTTTKYYSGDNASDLAEAAWYSNSGVSTHQPVGQKEPNAFGLYDMHGNVTEWCNDWYGSYSSSDQSNPVGLTTGSWRVDRGGAFSYTAANCRSAYRYGGVPSGSGDALGFRVVRRP